MPVGGAAHHVVQCHALQVRAGWAGGLEAAGGNGVARHGESHVLHLLLIHAHHAGGRVAKALEAHWQNTEQVMRG